MGFTGPTCASDTLNLDANNPFIRGGSATPTSNVVTSDDHSPIQARVDQLERVNAVKQAYEVVQNIVRDVLVTKSSNPVAQQQTQAQAQAQAAQQAAANQLAQQQQAIAVQAAIAAAVAPPVVPVVQPSPQPSSDSPLMGNNIQSQMSADSFDLPHQNPTNPYAANYPIYVGPNDVLSTTTRSVHLPGEKAPIPKLKIDPKTVYQPYIINDVISKTNELNQDIKDIKKRVDDIKHYVPHHHH